jgi:hypothetical protein
MQDETLDVDVSERKSYPWARSLLIIVLYISLLIFLWHFPAAGVQRFFRNLMTGFGYLLAGLALVGLTLLALMLIPAPLSIQSYEDMSEGDEDDWAPFTLPGRVMMIPALKNASKAPEIIDLIYDFAADHEITSTLLVTDVVHGALSVAADEDEDIAWILNGIKARLREADIRVHNPR